MSSDATGRKKRKSRSEKEVVSVDASPEEHKKDTVVEDAGSPSIEKGKKEKRNKKKRKLADAHPVDADAEAEVPGDAAVEKKTNRKATIVEEIADETAVSVKEAGEEPGSRKKKPRWRKKVADGAQTEMPIAAIEEEVKTSKRRKARREEAPAKEDTDVQQAKEATEELARANAAEEIAAAKAAEEIAAVKAAEAEAKVDNEKAKADKKARKTKTPAVSVIADDTPTSVEQTKTKKKKTTETAPSPAPAKSKKAISRPKSPSPDPEPSQSDEASAVENEEDVHLHGFSTDEDSSDDDMDAEEIGVDLGSLPTIARDDATVKRKLDKARRQPAADRGVVYLGRIPHGFYEDQMKAYFSQFGDVTRLRLSRSKKTGRLKHYGFVEFESASVAQIVAETMDNYLLMGHILTCKAIPKDEIHPSLWVGADRKWHAVPNDRLIRVKHNKPRTTEEQQAAEARLLRRQEARKRKLADAGIDYNFDAISYKKPKAIGGI